MGRFTHLVAIAALVANSGCMVYSISPLATDKDAVFEPALLGKWGESPTEWFVFSKFGENAYKVVSSDSKATMVVHLVRFDGVLFLDVAPSSEWAELGVPEEAAKAIRDSFLPLHFFARVNQLTPSLSLSQVDQAWLEGFLKEHPTALAHTVRHNDVVLTGAMEDIQRFFRAHANTPGAYGSPTVLTRQK